MSSQEPSFSKTRKRSLWYRVPKSRVILGKHRGSNTNDLIRLATENSAKLSISNILSREDKLFAPQCVDSWDELTKSYETINQPSFRSSRASNQGYSQKSFVKFCLGIKTF